MRKTAILYAGVLALCLSFWAGWQAGATNASDNYKWVLRSMEANGLITIHGDFDIIVPGDCETQKTQ